MKIFYKTTIDIGLQGDIQECVCFRGLRELLKNDFIDLPKKKVMYGDFSESPKLQLHTKGFTLFESFEDIADRSTQPTKDDILIYGCVPPTYEMERDYELEQKVGGVVFIDGHDDRYFRECVKETNKFYFKRELYWQPFDNIFQLNFGVPSSYIKEIDFSLKKQLYPKTVPHAIFDPSYREQQQKHHIFTEEQDYINDIRSSWFTITMKKGGWSQLRDLEGLANGCLVLYKDYDKKPKYCAPFNAPYVNFSSSEEMNKIMSELVVDNKPTSKYLDLLGEQRNWLMENATCEKIAQNILNIINKYKTNE